MTLQETFDIVVNHLRQQNTKSLASNGFTCLYRGKYGRKCAAGVLIPDSKYQPDLELKSCTEETVSKILLEEGHDIYLVRELQNIHDLYDIPNWEFHFQRCAKLFNLVYNLPPYIRSHL